MAANKIGMLLEYHEILVGLFRKDAFPSDFSCIAAAREKGFDPDDVWRDVCEICQMRDEDGYYVKVGQLRAIAKRLRK